MCAKAAKRRLDARIYGDGLADSLKEAAALIMEGKVLVADKPVTSAGFAVRDDVPVRLRAGKDWVSRGAHKLLTAVGRFGLDFGGRVCLDVGASTGGFTHVMLKGGAARVYSLDVAYGMLDWSLRSDSRVVVMERRNARTMTKDMFDPLPDFVASDASFISLKLLLLPIAEVTTEDAEAVVLVKPQFEAEREDVGDGGVVRDLRVQVGVLDGIIGFADSGTPWGIVGAAWSGIKGPKGNIEYLLHLKKNAASVPVDTEKLVAESHEALDKKL